MPSSLVPLALLSLSLPLTISSPLNLLPPLSPRATCPTVHVFGARETTVPAGYGSSATVVNAILSAYPGSTSEAISYPACGGQASCGYISYANSVTQGTQAVINQVSAYAASCPGTKLVLVGYSQGSEIFDDALCGLNGGGSGGIAGYKNNIKAVIFMGDPRFQVGTPYNVGTCTAHGFDARPSGQSCGSFNSIIKSYCDAADPYCCTGNDPNVHQGYGAEYGNQALAFVKGLLG